MSRARPLSQAPFLAGLRRSPYPLCRRNHGFLIISTLGVKQRAVIMTLLYRKSLRLSNAARQESSVGQIVNLMSNDANRFPEFSMFVSQSHPGSPALETETNRPPFRCPAVLAEAVLAPALAPATLLTAWVWLRTWQVIRIWMVPIYLSVALAQLFSLLGAPALAGVAVLILGGWINSLVTHHSPRCPRWFILTSFPDRLLASFLDRVWGSVAPSCHLRTDGAACPGDEAPAQAPYDATVGNGRPCDADE